MRRHLHKHKFDIRQSKDGIPYLQCSKCRHISEEEIKEKGPGVMQNIIKKQDVLNMSELFHLTPEEITWAAKNINDKNLKRLHQELLDLRYLKVDPVGGHLIPKGEVSIFQR